jgi:DNA-binding SARP family transcriptional activator
MFGWAARGRLRLFDPRRGKGAKLIAGNRRSKGIAVPQTQSILHLLPSAAAAHVPWREIFYALPAAVLVIGPDGTLVAYNPAARAVLGRGARVGARCCEVLGCRPPGDGLAAGCVSALARTGDGAQAERQVQLADGASAWVSAAPAGAGGEVVVMLSRMAGPAGLEREDLPPRLRVCALGRTRIACDEATLAGEWLGHKPGQLLKYLVCERGRVVTLEELIDVFWPTAGRAGASSVRQAIHTLRDRLEPDRPKGRPSGYVVARTGGYELTPGRVWIDADDFEAHARAGLDALANGAPDRAEQSLSAAARAYEGDFLADEPYAEWALAERERLRDLAAQVLRALAGLKRAAGQWDAATEHLQRLAELEPLDLEAQRELLRLMLLRGRHSEALRRYDLVRRRYKRAFDADPGFTLADLA